MADAKGIRAGRAFVELFADDSKLGGIKTTLADSAIENTTRCGKIR